jgi:hypothetical protein
MYNPNKFMYNPRLYNECVLVIMPFIKSDEEVEMFLSDSLAASTKKRYEGAILSHYLVCSGDNAFPVTGRSLAVFGMYLRDEKNLSRDTIKSYLAAVVTMNTIKGNALAPSDLTIYQRVTMAIDRTAALSAGAKATVLSQSDVEKVKLFRCVKGSSLELAQDMAIVAIELLLRSAEVLKLVASDVEVLSQDVLTLKVTLRESKSSV